ncbi:unnamed protein product, partial [Prorocentrum cordatum]
MAPAVQVRRRRGHARVSASQALSAALAARGAGANLQVGTVRLQQADWQELGAFHFAPGGGTCQLRLRQRIPGAAAADEWTRPSIGVGLYGPSELAAARQQPSSCARAPLALQRQMLTLDQAKGFEQTPFAMKSLKFDVQGPMGVTIAVDRCNSTVSSSLGASPDRIRQDPQSFSFELWSAQVRAAERRPGAELSDDYLLAWRAHVAAAACFLVAGACAAPAAIAACLHQGTGRVRAKEEDAEDAQALPASSCASNAMAPWRLGPWLDATAPLCLLAGTASHLWELALLARPGLGGGDDGGPPRLVAEAAAAVTLPLLLRARLASCMGRAAVPRPSGDGVVWTVQRLTAVLVGLAALHWLAFAAADLGGGRHWPPGAPGSHALSLQGVALLALGVWALWTRHESIAVAGKVVLPPILLGCAATPTAALLAVVFQGLPQAPAVAVAGACLLRMPAVWPHPRPAARRFSGALAATLVTWVVLLPLLPWEFCEHAGLVWLLPVSGWPMTNCDYVPVSVPLVLFDGEWNKTMSWLRKRVLRMRDHAHRQPLLWIDAAVSDTCNLAINRFRRRGRTPAYPSTGCVAFGLALQLCEEVSMYGFGPDTKLDAEMLGLGSRYSVTGAGKWIPFHDFGGEHAFYRAYARASRARRSQAAALRSLAASWASEVAGTPSNRSGLARASLPEPARQHAAQGRMRAALDCARTRYPGPGVPPRPLEEGPCGRMAPLLRAQQSHHEDCYALARMMMASWVAIRELDHLPKNNKDRYLCQVFSDCPPACRKGPNVSAVSEGGWAVYPAGRGPGVGAPWDGGAVPACGDPLAVDSADEHELLEGGQTGGRPCDVNNEESHILRRYQDVAPDPGPGLEQLFPKAGPGAALAPRGRRWRSCAVVGSGTELAGRGLGSAIDSHEQVWRLNVAPELMVSSRRWAGDLQAEADREDVGERVDLIVANHH